MYNLKNLRNMKAIEKEMVNAVKNGKNFEKSNTIVSQVGKNTYVYLFGNCIYAIENGVKRFSLAGWNTVTTRSRLNALGVNVYQKAWKAFCGGVEISSRDWHNVE